MSSLNSINSNTNNRSSINDESNDDKKSVNTKKKNEFDDEAYQPQESSLSRKIEFEKGMPLSFNFVDNRIFTIPFSFGGYLTFVGKQICETPLNLCIILICIFYLIAFLVDMDRFDNLNIFYSVAFHLLILFIEIFSATISYISIYINDYKVNNQTAHIYDYERKKFVDSAWKEIKVGQIIKILKDEIVPADIILLESMDHKHQCYLDNSSISGNFDMFTIKKACNDTNAPSMKVMKFVDYIKNIKGILKCEEPNSNMKTFNGRLKLESFPRASNINQDNFVMRGATVKNVRYIYGLVVYTGMETKMMMTLKYTEVNESQGNYSEFSFGSTNQVKKNQFNRVIIKKDNEFIRQALKGMQILIIIVYFIILLVVLLMAIHEGVNLTIDKNKFVVNYLGFTTKKFDKNNALYEIFISFTRAVLTFHIFMPFDWFGLVKISYWFLSFFAEWDENIKRNMDEKVEIINSESLANFGQVRHILTDKTGTLTKRKFELKLCSIQGKLYSFQFDDVKDDSYIFKVKEDDINDLEILKEAKSQSEFAPLIKEFIESLSLCHSVKVSHYSTSPNANDKENNNNNANINNKAQPKLSVQENLVTENTLGKIEEKDFASAYCEEVATFKVLKKFGYSLIKSKGNIITLKINDKKKNYHIIGHNKYNKERKRMSIVIKRASGNSSLLLCKANDISAFDLINQDEKNEPEIIKSKNQIKELSKFGYRYFIILKRELNEEDTFTFKNKYKSAENYVAKSDEHLNKLAIEYEQELSLLGIIFFEEKIDPDLKYSISRLMGAGIKVWIASGDKKENVLSIGRALDLYDPKSIKGDFSDKDKPEDLDIKMSTLLMQFLFPNDKINKMKTRKGVNVDVKANKGGNSKDLTLLISGNCFTRICNDQRNYQSLATLLSFCTSLLAYNFSPNNKLVLCQMIENYCSKNSKLLAAGDGFNDFSMLREADLSVGILSREILQVRNTCDVIVSNFSQIVDLILVHGTLNYRKILKISLLSFYMHFLLLIPKLLYLNENFYGQCFYDEYNLIFILNILLLNLYILFMETFDVPVERALITLNMNVFKNNIYDNNNMIFKFCIEAVKALLDSSLIFFLNKSSVMNSFNIQGETIDLAVFGTQILNCSYCLIIIKTLLLNINFINYIHLFIIILTIGCLIGITFINDFYQDNIIYSLTHLNTLLNNLLLIFCSIIYELAAKYIIFLFDYDFLSKLTIKFKNNISNFLFVKNYQQLLTNMARETPQIPNKLDKISYPEVLNKIFTKNKQLDPALENMADVSNDEAANLKIRKPLLKFFDQKVEIDYIEYCDMKVTIPYIIYLISLALFLAVDIALRKYESQKIAKIIYIIVGVFLLIPKIKEYFSKIFSVYFSIILVIELILIYSEKSDNDVKICFQVFVLFTFPLNFCPRNSVITVLTVLYMVGITPAIFLNDYGINNDGEKNFLYKNLILIYLRQMSVYGVIIILIISSHYVQLRNRIEFLKYYKSKIELKKDNLIMANLIPEFVRAKMQRGERGAAYGYEEVSIVFCDIYNFDDLMGKLTPKEIISILDNFYSILDRFCQLHYLQKIETVGKTYMAAGGIKECEVDFDQEEIRKRHHSIRCFEFALDILDVASKMLLDSGDTIIVKIGIHKGKVIPAVVGNHKPQFSLIGDAVNTTSRMSSNGNPKCITCSEFAYEEIKTVYKKNFKVFNKDIKGKGMMNLYSYSVEEKKKPNIDKYKLSIKDKPNNLNAKGSNKNVSLLLQQSTKNSKRRYSVIRSFDLSQNDSGTSNNKRSFIEDSMLIVENSQDILLKTGASEQTNIFSDLNRFNNDVNAYNYNNYGNNNKKNKINHNYSLIAEKKEAKFEKIPNTFFSNSILLYKFKEDASRNGFQRFENVLTEKSRYKSIYINTCFFALLLYSVYVNSHYSIGDEDYIPYLKFKTSILFLLIIFIFLTEKLIQNYQKIKFVYITLVYLLISVNNLVYNDKLSAFNLINMTVEEIVILTVIESCGIFNYLELSINLLLHIIIYIVDIVTNHDNINIRNYNIFLISIAVIKLINIVGLYFDMTTIFIANEKESKTLVDTEKMLFNLMPLHVVQNMKDDIPVADVLENVTLLFADIVSYTNFGNTHEPIEVVSLLSELFKNFDNATKACHVYKVHTIGDCYVVMGFNGKVSMNERNYYEEAKNVCKMGEEMIKIIRKVRTKVNYELLDMRIGIHTGTVIAGIIGSSVVRYDIFGSDVLIANKMESAGEKGKINISEDTKKLLESKDLPYSLKHHKELKIDSAHRTINCFLIENEIGGDEKK